MKSLYFVDNIWPPVRQSWLSLDMTELRAIQAITGWVTWQREQITSSQVVCPNTIYPIRWGCDLLWNQFCGNPINLTINTPPPPTQRAKPFHNYTGCIQIIEINNRRNFHTSDAIAGSNIDQCRWCFTSLSCGWKSRWLHNKIFVQFYSYSMVDSMTNTSEVCGDGVCRNGGTCRRLAGEAAPSCHCPLHFTGALCEKGELGHLSRLEPAELSGFQMCFWFSEHAQAAWILREVAWPLLWYHQEPANKLC